MKENSLIIKQTIQSNYLFYFLIIIYTIYLWNYEAKYSFSPTDEARVLGYIQRISTGQIPHLDFMFPHLAGTAYLYYFLNFLNTDVIFLQRLIGVLVLIIYSYLILKISGKIFDEQNALIKFFLVVFSLNINMHTFTLYRWSTTDAILFSVLGAYIINSSKKYKFIGYIMLGAVPIIKSGFLFSTLILFIYFILNQKIFSYEFFKLGISFSIIPVSYLSLIYFNSALDEMFFELFGLPHFWDRWLTNTGLVDIRLVVFTFISCVPFFLINKRFKNLDIAFPLVLSILFLIHNVNFSDFGQKPKFFLYSLFIFIAIFILKNSNSKLFEFELPFLLCLILGFSTILSDGWSVSLWVNGSILSLFLLLVFKISYLLNSYKKSPLAFFGLKILLIILIFYVPLEANNTNRDSYNYRDLSNNEELTYNLNEINKYYGNIYTSENVFKYLSSIEKCIDKLDTKFISVYPDNPYIYAMYNLQNPLIIDRYEGYFVSTDYDDKRLSHDIKNLNNDENAEFAILLQTYPASKLVEYDKSRINVINDRYEVGFHPERLKSLNFIKENLVGDVSTCASFEIITKNIEN